MGLQTALHFNPSGYRLLEVGLNARRVVQFQEYYRFVSASVLHFNLPHLASNMAVSVYVQYGAKGCNAACIAMKGSDAS